MRDALGNEATSTYNAAGRRLTETDAHNQTTEFIYDKIGRLVETQFADGTTTSTAYNDANFIVSETNQAGQTTYFTYDELDRLIEVIYPDETPQTIADNPRTKTEYDTSDRVIAYIDELGNRTEYEYDLLGRQTLWRDALGNETTYTYDDRGNLLTETDALGYTTQFVYDESDSLIATHFHDGTFTTTYDDLGRTIAVTDQAGNTTQFEYDPIGRLSAVVDALGQKTQYLYDLGGNHIGTQDANNNLTQYEYDPLNRRTATILPMGQSSLTTYDAVGNVASFTDFNGDTIQYEYDQLNRLIAKNLPDSTTTEYTYTPTGQIETITDQRGITTYDYDVRERLIEQVNPDNHFLRYTYDDASNRTGVITSSGTTAYTYDKNNRLETVTSSLGDIKYSYDDGGNLIKTEYPNNTAEIRTYDDLNRLVSLKNVTVNPNTGQEVSVISSYDYTLDEAGNRLSVTEHNGRVVEYEYDELYRLTQEKITDGGAVRTIDYEYDPIGNRLSRDDSVLGSTTYTYNDNDWLTTEQTNGQVTNYTYDNNGNTLSQVQNANNQTVYTWDGENRLIGAQITSGADTVTTTYEYDADGVRVASVVDGVETRYLVDANRPYAQVLEEYDPDGTVAVAYVYGHDLIAQVRDGEESFYHVDGLGSTTALTDGDGNIANTYVYGAYGNLISSSGNTANNYLYTGEQYDSNLGDYYLRARYYDPGVGRFTARDPFEGFLDEPLSLAKYPYVHGNPVNATDPSGLLALAGSLTKTQSILANIATNSFRVLQLLAPAAAAGSTLTSDSSRAQKVQVRNVINEALLRTAAVTGDRDPDIGIPIVFYGATYNATPLFETTQHIHEAILGQRRKGRKYYPDSGQRPDDWILANDGPIINAPPLLFLRTNNSGKVNGWYRDTPECHTDLKQKHNDFGNRDDEDSRWTCDEYPFNSTDQGGRGHYNSNKVSLKLVPKEENYPQGRLMHVDTIMRRAGVTRQDPHRAFGVVPMYSGQFSPLDSFWRDRNGNIVR